MSHASSNPTHVILVRHGQSTYNVQGRYQGCCDASRLTEQGHWMAARVGLALRRHESPITALYTSPLQRAQETTADILDQLQAAGYALPEVFVHPALQEIALPDWEGLPFKAVQQQFAQPYQVWREQPHLFQMEPSAHRGGSTTTLTDPARFPVQTLYAQAQQFWQDRLPHHRGQTLLIVSHGGTLRALIHTALNPSGLAPRGLPPAAYFHRWQQSNGGISHLTFPADLQQPAQLVSMNLTQALGEVLPKLKSGKTGLRLLLLPRTSTDDAVQQSILQTVHNAIPIAFCRPAVAVAEIVQVQHYYQNLTLSDTPLTTGLITTTPSILQAFLTPVLGLPTESEGLAVQPDTLTILHFPDCTKPPILQAFNVPVGLPCDLF